MHRHAGTTLWQSFSQFLWLHQAGTPENIWKKKSKESLLLLHSLRSNKVEGLWHLIYYFVWLLYPTISFFSHSFVGSLRFNFIASFTHTASCIQEAVPGTVYLSKSQFIGLWDRMGWDKMGWDQIGEGERREKREGRGEKRRQEQDRHGMAGHGKAKLV